MKKIEIFKIWKDLWLDANKIEKIILKITDLSKSQLFLVDLIDDKYIKKINESFNKLNKWEPFEYIINNAEFYSLDFFVDNRVLIPRNDTEIMVDKAIETIVTLNNSTLIDVWTWSWCVGISIFKNTKKITNCYLTDISRQVLEVSQINITKHNLLDKIVTIKSNLLVKFIWNDDYPLSSNLVITANLPYIKNWDYKNMSKETIWYEPDLALYGWKKTGFELYETLINECLLLKKLNNIKKIFLFIEIWFDQKDHSNKYLTDLLLKYQYFKDNWWIERCVKIEI